MVNSRQIESGGSGNYMPTNVYSNHSMQNTTQNSLKQGGRISSEGSHGESDMLTNKFMNQAFIPQPKQKSGTHYR